MLVDDEQVEGAYRLFLDSDDTLAEAATLERRGGPCPICGVEFNVVFVDNKYGCFHYYQPSCLCFKRCEWIQFPHGKVKGCGRWLIAERLAGIDYCTSCNYVPPEPKVNKVKRMARQYSGKDAATGEKSDDAS